MNVKSIKNWAEKIPIKPIIIVVLLFLIGLLVANLSGEYCRPYFIKNLGITETSQCCNPGVLIVRLGYAIGGVIASLVAVAALERVRALDQGNIEDRYKNAIKQLGNENSSVRLGGAYGLYYLARDNEDRRRNICDVLCAHIRYLTTDETAVGKTIAGNEIIYSKKYEDKPSDEVQSILNLLTKKDSPFKSDQINLENAYLNGANLFSAQLQRAYLKEAKLQGADLSSAQLQGAYLYEAQLQGANLRQAQLQGAYLGEAQLQGADLYQAQLQKTYLWESQFQGASLWQAQLQVANLRQAQLQGANLDEAQLQGANLDEAELQGTNLEGVQFQGANLFRAQLQEASLIYAKFQGAYLRQSQLQWTILSETDFRGSFTEENINFTEANIKKHFAFSINDSIKRLKARRNQKHELKNVIFSGGVTTEQLENFKQKTVETLEKLAKIKDYDQDKINNFKETMTKVEKILEDNLDKPIDTSIPSGVITGVYPQAEADKIIAMLEKIKKTTETNN